MVIDPNILVVIKFLAVAVAAGASGTAVMSLFLQIVTRSGACRVDMVRSTGALFVESAVDSYRVGAVIHLAVGISFAILYLLIFSFFSLTGFFPRLLFGAGIGFMHGFVFIFLLVVLLAEHHPRPEYRLSGVDVAVSHLFAHMLYGATIGVILAALNYQIATV